MQEKILGKFIFTRMHAGPVFTHANTAKYFRGIIFRILAQFLGEFILVRIHVAPVLASVRIQEKIPGKLFMYWFRASGYYFGVLLGKSKWGLSKRGLSPKGANWAQKGPFGEISAASPRL